MTAESVQTPPTDIIDRFSAERFAGQDPASARDFADLQRLATEVAMHHQRGAQVPGVLAGRFVRRQGEPADSPRVRVAVGEYDSLMGGTSNLRGAQVVKFTMERGRKGNGKSELKERSGESVSLNIVLKGDSVMVVDRRAYRGGENVQNSGYSSSTASKALLQEITAALGSPEELAPAPTRAEKIGSWLVGRLSIH